MSNLLFDLQLFAEESAEASDSEASESTEDTSAEDNTEGSQESEDTSDNESEGTDKESDEEESKKEAKEDSKKESEEKEDTKDKEQKEESKELDYSKIKVPDGFKQPTSLFLDFAKGQNMQPEQVQGLVDFYANTIVPMQQAQVQAKFTEWRNQSTDEFSQEQIDGANNAFKELANDDKEALELFENYGLGNNPAFIRMFSNLSKSMKESTLLQSTVKSQKSTGDLLFGKPGSVG